MLDELNVKALRFAGDEGEIVAYTVKPNLKVLGPRLGKQLGALQAALKEADAAALVASARRRRHLRGRRRRSVSRRRSFSSRPARPRATRSSQSGPRRGAQDGRDDALREEGLARELIHAVQLARKNAGLRIEDTIRLTLSVPDELRPLVERHAARSRPRRWPASSHVGEAPGDHRETARVEGHDVGIGLSVTGTIFTVTYG